MKKREGVNLVWVVEDNKLHAQIITRCFDDHTETRVFENGASLLEHLSSGAPLCDVMVLDWRLPDMQGIDVCRFLRTSYDEISLPILILTSQGNKSDAVEGLTAGANDYLTKPFDQAELRARVAILLRIKHLNEARKQADREREHYQELVLGMVGHDLRMPLSAIAMGTDTMMIMPETTDAQNRLLVRMKSSTGRMARMIEQIVDFTRSRFGGIELKKQDCDVQALAVQCSEEFALASPDSELRTQLSDIGHAYWDMDRVAQAIGNLLANARTHGSKTQPIVLSLRRDGDHAEIDVLNQGTPISAALQQNIFDPFRRGDQRPHGGQKGLGLGLYITRQIVEAHHGTIQVESSAEQGTLFRTRLPMRAKPR